MGTLALPGRKTDRLLRMGMSKKLGGFGSGSREISAFTLSLLNREVLEQQHANLK